MIRTRSNALRGNPVRLYYRFYVDDDVPYDPVIDHVSVSFYNEEKDTLEQVYFSEVLIKESDGVYYVEFVPEQAGVYLDEVVYKDSISSTQTHTTSFIFYVEAPVLLSDETICVVKGQLRSVSGEPVSGVKVIAEVIEPPRFLKASDGPSMFVISPRYETVSKFGRFELVLTRNVAYRLLIPGESFVATFVCPDKAIVDIGEILTADTTKISEIGYNVRITTLHNVVVYYDGMPGGRYEEESSGETPEVGVTPPPPPPANDNNTEGSDLVEEW